VNPYLLFQSTVDPELFYVATMKGDISKPYESGSLRWLIEDLNEEAILSSLPAGGCSPVAAASEGKEDQRPTAPYEVAGSEDLAQPPANNSRPRAASVSSGIAREEGGQHE
jgi:hypothetical protein